MTEPQVGATATVDLVVSSSTWSRTVLAARSDAVRTIVSRDRLIAGAARRCPIG